MKLAQYLFVFAGAGLLTGCASTITPEAQRVVLHSQLSAVLADCKKLGNVMSEAKVQALSGDERQQAINNLRDLAYKQYQADTVALVNIDRIENTFMTEKYVAQGVAFKCNN